MRLEDIESKIDALRDDDLAKPITRPSRTATVRWMRGWIPA